MYLRKVLCPIILGDYSFISTNTPSLTTPRGIPTSIWEKGGTRLTSGSLKPQSEITEASEEGCQKESDHEDCKHGNKSEEQRVLGGYT